MLKNFNLQYKQIRYGVQKSGTLMHRKAFENLLVYAERNALKNIKKSGNRYGLENPRV